MSKEFDELWNRLVPQSGQAATVQGELLRAVGRMGDDYFANACCNWDAGFERLSSFAVGHLADGTFGPQTTADIRTDIEKIQAYGRRQDIGGYDLDAAFVRLVQAVVEWCQRHPDIIPHSPDPELKR